MDIRCPNCGTLYEFNEARLKPGGVNLKCSHCSHVFRVEGRSRRAGKRRGQRWMVRLTSSGEVLYCNGLTALQKWIIDRKALPEDEISKTGNSWKRLGEIGELSSFFQVAENIARLQCDERVEDMEPTALVIPPSTESLPDPEYFDPLAPGLPASSFHEEEDSEPTTRIVPPGLSSSDEAWPAEPEPSQDAVESQPEPAVTVPPSVELPVNLSVEKMGPPAPLSSDFQIPPEVVEAAKEKNSTMPMMIVGVVLLALLGGAAYLLSQGQKDPKKAPPRPAAAAKKTETPDAGALPSPENAIDAGSNHVVAALNKGEEKSRVEAAPAAKDTPKDQKPPAEKAKKEPAGQKIAAKPVAKPAAKKSLAKKPAKQNKAPASAAGGGKDLLSKGAEALKRGDAHGALAAYSRLAERNPGNAAAQRGRAKAYMKLGLYSGAIKAFKKALAVNGRDAQALLGMARAQKLGGKSGDAILTYKRFLSYYPTGKQADKVRAQLEKMGATP